MSKCDDCERHSDPFKMDYAPVWFAWHPVKTNRGLRWLVKVHRHNRVYIQNNLVGSWPSIYHEYTEHQEAQDER